VIRKALAAVPAVALLALAMWLQARLPTDEEQQAPLTTEGRTGQDVTTAGFSVRVRAVRLAASVQGRYPALGDRPITTKGIFVIVYATVTSLREPLQLDYAELHTTDGLSYSQTGRLNLGIANERALQALFPTARVFAFELPPGKLAGARLVTGHWPAPFKREYAPEVSIDLGFTERTAAALAAKAPYEYKITVPE
jgi:hypothetical protein